MLAGSANTSMPVLLKAYDQWAKGNWGAVLTGNVQVDVNHLGLPFDLALSSEYTGAETNKDLNNWSKYAQVSQQHGTPGIVRSSIWFDSRLALQGAGGCSLLRLTTLCVVAVALTILTGPVIHMLKGRLPPSPRAAVPRVNWTFLRSPLFWVYWSSNLLQGFGYFPPFLYLPLTRLIPPPRREKRRSPRSHERLPKSPGNSSSGPSQITEKSH
ncbi:hypothetical protein BJX99DRAFT_257593 [Aspergillus californicus]